MVGALAGGLLAFLAIAADLALGGVMRSLDVAVNSQVNVWGADGIPTYPLGTALSAIGDWRTVTTVTVVATLVMLKRRHVALAAWCAGISLASGFVVESLKAMFHRGRPEVLDHVVHGYSFPSGHTFSATAALGAALILSTESHLRRHRKARAPETHVWIVVLCSWAALALLTGFGRLLVHAHWLSDVMASWSLGLALMAAILLALSGAHPAGEPGPTPPETKPDEAGITPAKPA